MTNNLVALPPPQKSKKKRCKWKVVDAKGNEFVVEGTSITTEEAAYTVHVYDGNECILVVQEGVRVEIMDDPRLQVIKTGRKRTTKRARK
jgi:hypothetical protein